MAGTLKLFNSNKLITWIQHRLSPKQFLIFSSILIGVTTGLAAVFMKYFAHVIYKQVSAFSGSNQLLVALLPIPGITLCVLFVRYLNRDKLGKGLANILYAIAKKSSLLPKDQTYSHVITSA
ncbi:MAG: chloride channel protein, partial [Bacteroidia bacterium]